MQLALFLQVRAPIPREVSTTSASVAEYLRIAEELAVMSADEDVEGASGAFLSALWGVSMLCQSFYLIVSCAFTAAENTCMFYRVFLTVHQWRLLRRETQHCATSSELANAHWSRALRPSSFRIRV